MTFRLFQIDAFTDSVFHGNPACVVPLEHWLEDDVLQKIALENAVAETAFFIPDGDGFHLRWFTPEFEMDLCGHATLASAHVLKTALGWGRKDMSFSSRSGMLEVTFQEDLYMLDFPSRKPLESSIPTFIAEAFNIQPLEVLKSRDYMLVYASETQVRDIKVDRVLFDRINLDPGGVIVTAKGDHCDFVSRFFTPQASILEDPVTGSAHCSLIPFWSERLGKKVMEAWQVSDRLGKLYCTDHGGRVLIGGKAVTYSQGTLFV